MQDIFFHKTINMIFGKKWCQLHWKETRHLSIEFHTCSMWFEKVFPGPWCHPRYACWTNSSDRVPGESSSFSTARRVWWSPAPQDSYLRVLDTRCTVGGRDKRSRCCDRCTPSIIRNTPIPTRYGDLFTSLKNLLLPVTSSSIRSSSATCE